MLDNWPENNEKTKRVIVFRPSIFWNDSRKPSPEKVDYCPLILGGMPKSSVFLGYFPEQDRYRDEIRDFMGHSWTSYMTDVKYSCCRRLTVLSEEYSFGLEWIAFCGGPQRFAGSVYVELDTWETVKWCDLDNSELESPGPARCSNVRFFRSHGFLTYILTITRRFFATSSIF
jgi:hypothetical protein